MIEFDVLPERLDGTGRLLLAHDYKGRRRRNATDARGGSRAPRATAFADIELDVDLKLPGYEARWSTRCAPTGWNKRTLDLDEVASLAARARARARGPARLVVPPRAARLH